MFLGQHQSKLALAVVHALQPLGGDAEYIPIEASEPDAVDFHIAFYCENAGASRQVFPLRRMSLTRAVPPVCWSPRLAVPVQ